MTDHDDDSDRLREQAADWLLRLHAAPGDTALRERFEAWLSTHPDHADAYRRVARFWELADRLPHDCAESLTTTPRRRRFPDRRLLLRTRRPHRRPAALAAVVLGIALLIVLLPDIRLYWQADHLTGTGEVREVALEDGSLLVLDAASAVAVNYRSASRSVRLLAGRVYFEVTTVPDRPFMVQAGKITVTVTGTAFAVNRGDRRIGVAIRSGSVSVAAGPTRPSNRLAAGNRLEVSNAGDMLERGTVPPTDVAAWREGRLVVDNIRFADLIEQLDRHHRGLILLSDAALGERRITGVFDADDPSRALEAAAAGLNARVTALSPYLLIVGHR